MEVRITGVAGEGAELGEVLVADEEAMSVTIPRALQTTARHRPALRQTILRQHRRPRTLRRL